MALQIDWTEPALEGLEIIRDYIVKDSPFYARNFIERLFDATTRLEEFPKSGRPVPEAEGRDDIREVIYQGYRIIYLLLTDQDRLQVIAVIHGSRNFEGQEIKPWD
ncbi:MAG: type II toxin-antitoxin system RelE/ParE family toxin [Gammaproteobacteria bacterium]